MTSAPYTPQAARQTFTGNTPLPGFAPKLTFGGVLKSERIKLTSLRSFRITIIITLLFGIGMGFLGAFAWTQILGGDGTPLASLPPESLQNYLVGVGSSSSVFLSLIFGVLGVFSMSSEYSSGMILSTLTAVPKRTPVYVAKALTLTIIAVITALIVVAASTVTGIVFLPEAAGQLGTLTVISGLLGTVLYLVAVALIGFALAALLRSTAGGISVLVGITFVLPIGFQLLELTQWEWVGAVDGYLPMSIASKLSNGIVEVAADASGPQYWDSLVALLLWVAVPLVAGLFALKGRDAK